MLLRNLLAVLLIFSPLLAFPSQQKIALIIAIGNYPKQSGWNQINSVNDVSIIKFALLKQGFQNKNIIVLIDSAATKQGIINALNQLTVKSQKGDIAFIHYSGHGQQIQDNNGDEVDGYDESLIPFDSNKLFRKGVYEGQFHLRDDEFGVLLNRLRAKIGPSGDVCVLLDACHSGTATRAIQNCRGTEQVFQDPKYKPTSKANEPSSFLENYSTSETKNKLSPIVIISGSGKLELNYEYFAPDGKNYGSLSFAVSKILSTQSTSLSYRALFENIRMQMTNIAPRQNPQIEGNPDRLIFGGLAIKQVEYTTVAQWINQNTVIINSGILDGITINSTISFYPQKTANPAKLKPVTSGKITQVDLLTSKVIISNSISKETALKLWAFLLTKKEGLAAKIRALKATDKDLQTTMDIIPITVHKQNNKYIEDKRFTINSKKIDGQIIFSEGDCFKIAIKNYGQKTIYYQILDIQPDNRINLLVPFENRSPQEFYLKAGDIKELNQIFTISRPYGMEIFKLIATEKPINLNFNNNMDTHRSVESELNDQFFKVIDTQKSVIPSHQGVHISTFEFLIKPNN